MLEGTAGEGDQRWSSRGRACRIDEGSPWATEVVPVLPLLPRCASRNSRAFQPEDRPRGQLSIIQKSNDPRIHAGLAAS